MAQRARLILLGLLAASIAVLLQPPDAIAQGVLRITVGTSLANLDPARTTTGEEYIYDNLVFNGLTRMQGNLSIEPELAEKWEYTLDLKSWTFHQAVQRIREASGHRICASGIHHLRTVHLQGS